MNITVKQVQGSVPVTVLQPHGDLDASNYQELIAKAKSIYEEGTRGILLDLSNIPFMSSSGLVALHSIALLLHDKTPPDPESGWNVFHTIAEDVNSGSQYHHFKLLNPQSSVDQVLETTGFKGLFDVYADLEAALASYGANYDK